MYRKYRLGRWYWCCRILCRVTALRNDRLWCVPVGTGHRRDGTPSGRDTVGTGHPQDRFVPTAFSFKGDCRQWVAPAVGADVWIDRGRVVAEKQHRRLGGCFARVAAAKVVCPRWGPVGMAGVSPRLGCVPTAWFFSPQRFPSKATAASGWPLRLGPAFGVIEDVLLRKSNIAGLEAVSLEGQRRMWCVPAGTGAPARQVCPRGSAHGSALSFKGDCRQWVAPAVGAGVWSDQISAIAEKRQRSRRVWFVSGAAANVVCPRWGRPLGA